MEASALILAAGAGTRMKSSKPKVAHQILVSPLFVGSSMPRMLRVSIPLLAWWATAGNR